jgi:peptidyl-prolyl cis-trans isomerase SurA
MRRFQLYAVVLLLGMGAAVGGVRRDAGAAERIAAVVNKEVILESDVDDQLRNAVVSLHVDPDDSVSVAKLRKEVLQQLIDEQVILAEAARQGTTIPKAELDQAVDQAIRDLKARLGSEDNYRRALAQEGTTETALRKKYEPEVRKQLLVMRLVGREVQSKTNVTDAEARSYFTAHRDSIGRRPERLNLAHILIGFEPDSSALKRARVRADSVRTAIAKGASFGDMARKYSDDPSGKTGGDLHTFGRGEMVPEFEEVAFQLKPMELSPLVRTRFGYHIIQTLEHTAATDSTPESVHARHILFQVKPTPADEERARKRALAIRDSLLAGANFAAMAKRYSMDSATKDSAGALGEVAVPALPENFRDPLQGLRDGEVSVPLKGEAGYHVFRVLVHMPESDYAFDDIKEDLKKIVLNQKLRDNYDRWLERIRKNVNIELKN